MPRHTARKAKGKRTAARRGGNRSQKAKQVLKAKKRK